MKPAKHLQPFRPGRVFIVILALLLLVWGLPASASNGGDEGKLDSTLRVLLRGHRPTALALTRSIDGQETVEVVIQARTDIAPPLRELGAKVRSVIGKDPVIITADVPIHSLQAITSIPELLGAHASRRLEPDLDTSVPETRADQVWGTTHQGLPVKGQGVIVAVVDSGIDWRHGDFKDAQGNTRILEIWDQNATGGTPPAGFDYGNMCTREQINQAQCAEIDTDGHGTHVASTAAGNGLSNNPPRFVGMAPEADLLIVKSPLTTAKSIDAWHYIKNKARTLGRPVVINNSWGGQFGAHDGTSGEEKALDQLSDRGVVFVKSAGNDGDRAIHAEGNIGQGQEIVTNFAFAESNSRNVAALSVWYNGNDSMSTSVTAPNGQMFGPVLKGAAQEFNGPDDTKIIIDAKPSGGHPDGTVTFAMERPEGQPVFGSWSFTLGGDSITSGGRWDAWILIRGAEFTSNGNNNQTLSVPATARKVITVASYTTKPCWDSLEGKKCYTQTPTVGNISGFSSIGPTRDGREKPDVAAPGEAIVAAKSRDYQAGQGEIAPDNEHLEMEGTSMAAPHVTGAIALMLQVNPTLNSDSVMHILRTQARQDDFTGPVWNSRWGMGKLDAKAAVEAAKVATAPAGKVYLPALMRNYRSGTQPTPTSTPVGPGPTRTSTPITPGPTATPTQPVPTATPGPSCTSLIANGSFETGADGFANWTLTAGVERIALSHSGGHSARLGEVDSVDHWLGQGITFPANATSSRITFWYQLTSTDDPDNPFDYFRASLYEPGPPESQVPLVPIRNLSNQDTTANWTQASHDLTDDDLSILAGQTVYLWFNVSTDEGNPTTVYVDDVSVEVCATP